jgi:hypothetical protein
MTLCSLAPARPIVANSVMPQASHILVLIAVSADRELPVSSKPNVVVRIRPCFMRFSG